MTRVRVDQKLKRSATATRCDTNPEGVNDLPMYHSHVGQDGLRVRALRTRLFAYRSQTSLTNPDSSRLLPNGTDNHITCTSSLSLSSHVKSSHPRAAARLSTYYKLYRTSRFVATRNCLTPYNTRYGSQSQPHNRTRHSLATPLA